MPNRAETVLSMCIALLGGFCLAAIWGDRAAVAAVLADVLFRAVACLPLALAAALALAAIWRIRHGRDA